MAKKLMILSVVLIVATLGRWLYDSNRYGEMLYYSKTAKITTVYEEDPLFGSKIPKTTTETGSWLGLLDIGFPFGALPLCGVWAALGIVGFMIHRKQKTAS